MSIPTNLFLIGLVSNLTYFSSYGTVVYVFYASSLDQGAVVIILN